MAATMAARRPVKVTQWISLPLSVLMIFASILTFTGSPSGNGIGRDSPVFTSFRSPPSALQIYNQRRIDTPAWVFSGAKGAASICWCVLIPLQHNTTVRRKWPAFHRTVGYLAIFLSIELGIAGYWMIWNGSTTSHKNLFHIHSVDGYPFLVWPTFKAMTLGLSVLYYYTLYRLYVAIKARDFESHRRWAVSHTMLGYTIALSRFFAFVVIAIGKTLVAIPKELKDRWIQLPVGVDAVVAAEVSALAWTLAISCVVTTFWAYYEWSQAGLIGVWSRSSTSSAKKIS